MLPGAASSVRSIPNVSPYLGGRQGERFPFHINRDLIPSFIEYIVTVLSGAFPSLLGIVWRVSAAFLGDAVLMARYAVCYGVLAPLQRVKTIPLALS